MWTRVTSVGGAVSSSLSTVACEGGMIVCGVARGAPFAFDSTCPHKGGPLQKGELIDGRIRCPWHRYEFDVFTGRVTSIPYPAKYGRWRETGDLRLYPVKVSDGFIYVEVAREEGQRS